MLQDSESNNSSTATSLFCLLVTKLHNAPSMLHQKLPYYGDTLAVVTRIARQER